MKKQASARSKLRQHTLENASKLKKQRMDSNKTSFDKDEIAAAYVGKRQQAQKATYGQQQNKLRQGRNCGSIRWKTPASSKSNVWTATKQALTRMKLRQHTLKKTSKLKKQRMGSEKTRLREKLMIRVEFLHCSETAKLNFFFSIIRPGL